MNEILSGKKILLGITGCIAAYKSCMLVRELVHAGADVKVVLTENAARFVSPLTLAALSKNPVITGMFPQDAAHSVWHIELGVWANVMLIAPASVNTIAKLAHGFADNSLTTLALAMRAPIIAAPTADVDMYENPVTQRNFKILHDAGFTIIPAEEGELASGLIGRGRLPEIPRIIDSVETVLSGYRSDLRDRKILITAGPTYEDIDPVRYIGNRSSGKMGYALAKAAHQRGASVTLISGPSSEKLYQGIPVISIRSAAEMKRAVEQHLPENEVLIMAAAPADFTPAEQSERKIKKSSGFDSLRLTHTEDILASLNKDGKKIIGFALETNDEKENALRKLSEKGLDSIILNSLNDSGSGFETDTNKITILMKDGRERVLPLLSKFQTAHKILDTIHGII